MWKSRECQVGDYIGRHDFTEWSDPKNGSITATGGFRAMEKYSALYQTRHCVKCKLAESRILGDVDN